MYADLPVNAIADGHLSWGDPAVQAHIRHLDWCEWYECDHGFLYIADPDSDDSVHGPDNEMADAIHEALQQGAPFHHLEDYVEGLAYIHHVLHRFTREEGFYHA